MSNSLNIIKKFHAAFAAGHKEAAFAMIADDAIWYSDKIDAPWSGTHHGIEAIKQHFADAGANIQADNLEGRKFLSQRFIEQDELVIELGDLSIKFTSNQQSFSGEYVCVYTIENNKICTFKVFEDSMALYNAYHC